MTWRSCFLPLFIIILGCAVFMRRDDFEEGKDAYYKSNFVAAAKYFSAYYQKHPASEITMYYLYDCYQRLNETAQAFQVLEQLAQLGVEDQNVYLNLFSHYQESARYQDLYQLLVRLKPGFWPAVDKKHTLTRRLYAEILLGAFGNRADNKDPVGFALKGNFLEVLPDGQFYEDDAMTIGNLIIALDRLFEPIYPSKFYAMTNVPNHSFIYLPYMRLVGLGILNFDQTLDPDENAPISMAIQAINNLKVR